ncbi:uncharacterized protein BJ212DRAFT_1479067 [Suillus subaureus]|uniref:Uncharacterized protein n=1 Tax=Suillus subaureus TaxID=48587 RepID=A0A9P7EGB7_9AGAM|nr:uncharacterized protein BJ212DRAFT_1479067 [Suillus subaureus]KAG1819845.1 hypothetical protein BJ212DRAFT_1479067 [Suillus subaureus]
MIAENRDIIYEILDFQYIWFAIPSTLFQSELIFISARASTIGSMEVQDFLSHKHWLPGLHSLGTTASSTPSTYTSICICYRGRHSARSLDVCATLVWHRNYEILLQVAMVGIGLAMGGKVFVYDEYN